jgi:hypothetical protein
MGRPSMAGLNLPEIPNLREVAHLFKTKGFSGVRDMGVFKR